MLRKILFFVLLIVSLAASLVSESQAHLRNYLVNYGYSTTPQGAWEIEYYSDYDIDQSAFKVWQQKIEVEYGLTDHLMTSIYGIFKQSPAQRLSHDSSKVEFRYRLAEYQEWFVDPALYLEFVHQADRTKNDKIEAKLLLSKDVGDWNFVTNLKFYERDLTSSAVTKYGYTLGVSRDISAKTTLGLEFKGSLGNQNSFGLMNKNKHYIIPGVYFTAAKNVQVNLGLGLGLTPSSTDLSFKTIVEWEI